MTSARGLCSVRNYLLWQFKNISNAELYAKRKTEPWSTTIRRQHMNRLGHIMWLHPEKEKDHKADPPTNGYK